jgi:hypothetical protein
LVAVNVNTGKIAWRSTLGVTDSLPQGKRNTGRPGLGGAIITANGLVFIGATNDARFRAFDESTGKEIWAVGVPAAAEATPIAYAEVHGDQYVAVVATGGGLISAPLLSDVVVAYSHEWFKTSLVCSGGTLAGRGDAALHHNLSRVVWRRFNELYRIISISSRTGTRADV